MGQRSLVIWWETPQANTLRPCFWEGVGIAFQTFLADLFSLLTFELDEESGV